MPHGMIKIDAKQLVQWINEGVSQRECARRFGCTPTAIGKHVRKMKLATARYSIEGGGVYDIYKSKMDAAEQLSEANRRVGTIAMELEERKDDDGMELQIKANSEIRQQVATALNIQKTLFEVSEVQKILKTIIGYVNKYLTPEQQRALAEDVRRHENLTLQIGGGK